MTPSSPHRAALAVVGVLLLAAVAVPAQPGGTIHLYSDPAFGDTTATDTTPGTLTLYVVWRGGPPGAVAWWFKLSESAGFTGVWTGETPHTGGVYGNTRTGIHLVEASCLPSPAHILTVTYQMAGTSQPCVTVSVVSADAADVRINSCASGGMLARGGKLTVNSTGCSVPLEPTSWGRIKALYRQAVSPGSLRGFSQSPSSRSI